MFDWKTLTALVSVGLVGGGVALLLFAPEKDRGRATPPASAGTSINDAYGGPTEPGQQLFRKASREGIEKVRDEFRVRVQKQLGQIEPPVNLSLKSYGNQPLFYNPFAANDAGRHCYYWAKAEAQAIYRGAPVPNNFDDAIWKPLLEGAQKSHTAFADAVERFEQWQRAGFPEDEYDREIDKIMSSQEVPEEKQKGVRQRIRQNLRNSFKVDLATAKEAERQSEGLFLELAELAKIVKRPDLVKQVYKAYDGALPKQQLTAPHYVWVERVGELDSAEEFLNYDHRALFRRKYVVARPPQPEPPPPGSKFPVTEQEQKAIREMLAKLWTALINEDKETLLDLAVDDREKLNRTLEEEFASIKSFSYDTSRARYEFFRDNENGPVRVNVEDLIVDREIAGKRRKGQTRKTYHIVFVGDNPRVRIFEESEQRGFSPAIRP